MASAVSTPPSSLHLLANDAEDLGVISAMVQDAVCTVGDIAYESAARRLTVTLNRFRWEAGAQRKGGERVRAALQFGGVLQVKTRRLRRDAKRGVLALLSVGFDPGEAPGGVINLHFAGDGGLQLQVECIDAVLADLSAPWATPRRPSHETSEG